MNPLATKRLILGLSGGIACYKAAQLCRLLVQAGAQVQVVMTEAATHFITPTTLQALSNHPVYSDSWDSRPANHMPHIALGRECDAIVVAPASADFMAKLVHGRADDLLSLTLLARPLEKAPLILAPAMNREMWAHPATQRNIAQLRADGTRVLEVGTGEQACGETGDGRMLEAEEILAELVAFFTPKVLLGKKVLLTAGPTFEPLDPVRGITNRSSGKMGFALARAAWEAGAQVTLVSGPVGLATPWGVTRINVQTARDMLAAVEHHAETAQVFIATAAVADWRPVEVLEEKIKKSPKAPMPATQWAENPDILARIAASPRAKTGQLYCVGFAAESHHLLEHALAKRLRKNIPLLVGNIGPATFGLDDNALVLIDAQGATEWPRASKYHLAQQLVQTIAQRLSH